MDGSLSGKCTCRILVPFPKNITRGTGTRTANDTTHFATYSGSVWCVVCVCVCVWVCGWVGAGGEGPRLVARRTALMPTLQPHSRPQAKHARRARRATQASHLQLLAISSLLLGRPVGQHTITNDQACDQEGGIHLASASQLMGNAAVKCSDAAVRQRTEDTERGARLEAHLARLTTSSRSTRTRRFTNVHLIMEVQYYKGLSLTFIRECKLLRSAATLSIGSQTCVRPLS